MPDYEKIARAGSGERYESKPYEASVTSVNPDNETLSLDGAATPEASRVPHPMLSPNSWIRALPEKGARVVLSTIAVGPSPSRRAVLSYYSRAVTEYISRYKSGTGLYKPLLPGEWDLMTTGVAYIYGTATGKLYLRGGPVQQELDPKRLRIRSRAPTYRRELHQNLDSEIQDIELFGVVVRNKSNKEKNRWIQVDLEGSTSDKDYKGDTKTKSFAKEYLRVFSRDGTQLVDYREGDVFDDEGTQLKQSSTGKNLRMRSHLYTKGGEDKVATEIDEEGSILLETPGSKVEITASSAAWSEKLKSLDVSTQLSIAMAAQTTAEITANATGRYSGSTSTILGPDPVPINAAIKGTMFNAQILVPFFNYLANMFEALGKPPPNGPAPSGAFDTACKAQMLAGATLIKQLTALLPTMLSLNVKISQ